MAKGKALDGKPYAGNPHVRFDEGEVAPAATPRRGSLLYKVSFADLETNTDGNGNSCTPNFATVSFPGNIGGKHDWFAVEVKGFIKIPRPGWWSFACGSDDGFETTISGHGKSFTFAYDGHRWYATDVKPFYFEEAGVYKVQIVFFDYHINATLDFSMAEGYYTSFRSSIFHLAEAVDGVCTVSYNANCGTGTMAAQTFEESKEQKLSKNIYHKDGFVFQGWAETKADADNGFVKYRDEALIIVDSDMTLYAVWANPPLTLTAESANWSSGSITLKCEDADTSGAVHAYSLEYKNESGTWTNVNEAAANNIAVSVDGFAHLTDNTFWSRLGGLPPVEYRVKDENGRVSEPCVTRTRYGIVVGLGSYDPNLIDRYKQNGYDPPSELSQCKRDAEIAHEVMAERGGFIGDENLLLLTDGKAKKKDISDSWRMFSQERTKTGDVVFFVISTHGNASGAMLVYDGHYTREMLQKDIEPFRSGARVGVKVVIVLMSCHSEAMTSAVREIEYEYGQMCTANIVYLAGAAADEYGWITNPRIWNDKYTQIGEFFFNQGLKKGQADEQISLQGMNEVIGNRNKYVDLLECAKFSECLVKGRSNKSPSHVQYDKSKSEIMAKTILVSNNDSAPLNPPERPNTFNLQGKEDGVLLLWDDVSDVEYYIVHYNTNEVFESEDSHWMCLHGFLNGLERLSHPSWDNGFLFKTADMATAGDREMYVPLDNDKEYHFWIESVNVGGKSAAQYVGRETTPAAVKQVKYQVTFDPKGGTVSPATMYVNKDDRIGNLPTPTSKGRDFKGWSTKIDGDDMINEDTLVADDVTYYAQWTESAFEESVTKEWLTDHPTFFTVSNGDIATAAAMTAANGCKTVGECFAVGIDPEDPDDDFKVTHFEMKDGKPVITLNHTEDGSGNSFMPRVKTLGKADLSDAEWREVPEKGDSSMRFFKVEVEMP